MTNQSSASGETHKLNRAWTLWYDSPLTYNAQNWELSLVPIMTVNTVEDFFVMLKYMKPIHALRTSSQYHFFQEGVKPMWEDPANQKGGKIWVNVDIPKKDVAAGDKDKTELDQLWENVLMSLVGECIDGTADDAPQVIGAVLTKRKYYNRLAVWIREMDASAAIETIKSKLVKEMGLPASATVVVSKHGEKDK